MNILVTGGAGYVGSIVAEMLLQQGHKVIVLDNLQQGHRQAVLPEAELVVGDICDGKALDSLFQRFQIDAVMHMAAETVVEYSMTDPKRYFHNNVIGGTNLLDAMLKHGVLQLIFSSSAAVYGEPQSATIEEDHPKVPLNAYGESKLMFETVLQWYGKAYGIKHISLRYFNAAGASSRLGEDHDPETHLIPNVLRVALIQPPVPSPQSPVRNPQPQGLGARDGGLVSIFGSDYPTKDGSCIRDYVHVIDIAQAHVLALAGLDALSGKAYNLGSGSGYSVLEVVATARKVTGCEIRAEISPRRPGDPAVLVASASRAKAELGWEPRFPKLEPIIDSAWKWMRNHPDGYSGD